MARHVSQEPRISVFLQGLGMSMSDRCALERGGAVRRSGPDELWRIAVLEVGK